MKASTNSVVEVCTSRYENICGGNDAHPSTQIINKHFGEFSQDLVNEISNDVEMFMLDSGDKKGIVKRMFSILVEGLQNIRLHGERDVDGKQTSFFVIDQQNDFYKVSFGNLLKNKNAKSIEERILEVNEIDQEEIKQLYMQVLTNGVISNKGGAGLGFITMAMKSKNTLGYFIDPINDDLSCFTLIVTIDRKNKE